MEGQNIEIRGKLIDKNINSLGNLRIEAWDKDIPTDGFIGKAVSDVNGNFNITVTGDLYKDLLLDKHPGIYFKIYAGENLIRSTEDSVLWNIKSDEGNLEIIIDGTKGCDPPVTPKPNLVSGKITDKSNNPLANLKVEAYHADMREWQLLAETLTNEEGKYTLNWKPSQLSNGKKTADIAIKILTPEKNTLLFQSPTNNIRFKASRREEINITLSAPIPVEVIEYDYLLKGISFLAGKITVAALQENDEHQDVTFISKQLQAPPEKIEHLIVAHKMSAASKIAPDFFYALLRKDSLLKHQFGQFLGNKFSVGLQDDIQILLYDAALTDPGIIQQDIKAAISEMKVDAKLVGETGKYIKQLLQYKKQATEYYKNEHPQKAIELVTRFVTENKVVELQALFKENKYDLNAFFEKLIDNSFFSTDTKSADAKTHITLGKFFGFGNKIIPAVIKKYQIQNPTDIKKLARLNKAGWVNEIASLKSKTRNKDVINSYASILVRKFEKEYPTIAYAAQLEREEKPLLNNQEKIVVFLNKNEDFDLTKDSVTAYLKKTRVVEEEKNAIADELMRVQRVFKLVPHYGKTHALLNENIHSSLNIVTLGKTRFIKEIAPKANIDEKEAAAIYSKAEAKNTGAMLLAGQLQDMAGTAEIASFNTKAISLKLDAVSKDFPNLKTLFKLTDNCACEHCRSVLSPAAYLVELLQWLDKRAATDLAVTPAVTTNIAKNVLFERRPDLGEIDLSCANATTPVKYIDLVCELLEEAIAPDQGIDYKGALSEDANAHTGKIGSDLLDTLIKHGIPVTGNAQIDATETRSGSSATLPHYLRDTQAVCKIVNMHADKYKIYRLRQTLSPAEALDAAPEYVNDEAYQQLREKAFAFKLPFDLSHVEAKAYFDRFGIKRANLMNAFQSGSLPANETIAAEELELTDSERAIITIQKPTDTDQQSFWNVPEPGDVVKYMSQVSHFLDKTGISYQELAVLLKLKFITQGEHLFIRHHDLSCDTEKKEIINLKKEVLDRIHRFLRLQKKTGWKFQVLEEIISQARLGNNALNDACLIKISQLKQVADMTKIEPAELVGFYGEIPHLILNEESPKPLYYQIFLNTAKNGFIDEELAPEKLADESRSINTYLTSIASCLGLKQQDIASLLPLLTDGNLTFSNLSYLYAASKLMSKLRLTADDFVILTEFSGINISESPQSTLDFIQLADEFKDLPLKPAELQFILNHKAQNLAEQVITDEKNREILEKLQQQYQTSFIKNRSLFDNALSVEEQKETLKNKLSTLVASETDVKRLLQFVDGNWDNTTNAKNFVDNILNDLINTTSIKGKIDELEAASSTKGQDITDYEAALLSLRTATQQLKLADTPEKIAEAHAVLAAAEAGLVSATPKYNIASGKNILQAFLNSIAEFQYSIDKRNILEQTLTSSFKADTEVVKILLNYSALKRTAPGNKLVADILATDALIDSNRTHVEPVLPAITNAEFDEEFSAIRFLHKFLPFVKSFGLNNKVLEWHLQNNRDAIWFELDDIPYETGQTAADFEKYRNFIKLLKLAKQLTAVINPLDAGRPINFYTIAGMLSTADPSNRNQFLSAFSLLIGYNQNDIDAIDQHLFASFSSSNYRLADNWIRIMTCAEYLRKLSSNLYRVIEYVKPSLLPGDVVNLRATLKSRYYEAVWLNMLKDIMDVIRPQKRDALVAYLLADNQELKNENDLYDHFLVDVEMEACMPSSRIVQAHNSIQLFVQRCLMGLEPKAAASTDNDPNWNQWKWMKNYRVWEANRKVSLFPENWYDVTFTDDKSHLLTEFINELQQNELTEQTAEEALKKYLEKLDGIAFLEVMTSWYQTNTKVMHVFARTKGGAPGIYYYRRFEQERYWTPWEKVELDITGDHLLAFMRNNRLYLAWPVFTEEPDPNQESIMPDTTPGEGVPNEKPKRKLKIQLAISEYSNKKWAPKIVSEDAIKTPPDMYTNADLPKERFKFFYNQAAEQIVVFNEQSQEISEFEKDRSQQFFNVLAGAFDVTGCKGYTELAPAKEFRLDFIPRFIDTSLLNQRYLEKNADATDELSVVNTCSVFLREDHTEILGATPDTFRVTYPHQITTIDILVFMYKYLLARAHKGAINKIDLMRIHLGTLLPYFKEDSNHAYVIIPGYYKKESDENELPGSYTLTDFDKRTASNVFKLIEDINNWFKKFSSLPPANPPENYDDSIKAELYEILGEMSKYEAFDKIFDFLIGRAEDAESKELLQSLKNTEGLVYGEQFKNLYHPLVCYLRTNLYKDGISGLMKRETQRFETNFNFKNFYIPNEQIVPKTYLENTNDGQSLLYPTEDLDFSNDGSYSMYNWDLFFRVPLHIATNLTKNQRFEEALSWFHYIFNPTGALSGDGVQKYWVTKPFYLNQESDYIDQRIDTWLYKIANPNTPNIKELEFAIEQWRNKPFNPDVIARFKPVTYQKVVLMKYVENLTEWGDHLFRQDTMESVAQATQMYILADKLLGPKPRTISAVTTPSYETYNQMEAKVDAFGNALIELENILPELSVSPASEAVQPAPPVTLSMLYFCIPTNDKMLEYWERIADRLFKIRHCQNIEGVERSLALFAPPIEPGMLMRATAGGLDISSVLEGLNAPIPYHRFNVLCQKATELAQEVRGLGNSLLQALEKRDAESMALLRSGLELNLLNAARDAKLLQLDEANEQFNVLIESEKVTQERFRYYHNIEKINSREQLNLDKLSEANDYQLQSQIVRTIAGVLALIPEFHLGANGIGGSPEVVMQLGGSAMSRATSVAADILNILGSSATFEASRAATLGGYDRRFDDWKLQDRLAEKELNSIAKQKLAAEIRKDIAKKDLENHDVQIENARKTDEFMRSKFTNRELYDWMIGQISSVYFKCYQLAYDFAKKAERCYRFELGNEDTFISYPYWDNLKKGLQSADNLIFDIKRMELSYLDKNKREYEITKHISLALLDPLALIRLRTTGIADFEIPEALYDMDYPGQYFRRLKSVSISLPCIAGPYTSVNTKLSLISNRYRKNTSLDNAGYTEALESDPRFVYNVGAIQSIATSNAQNDSGIFELNFRDERYLPFEGVGAISSWRLELPTEVKQFDYATISDVIIHLRYTAREGGSGLKNTVASSLLDQLANIKQQLGSENSGLHVVINLKRDMPNEWHLLKNRGIINITIDKSRLPYFAQALDSASLKKVLFIARVKNNPEIFNITIERSNETNTIPLNKIQENGIDWKLCKGESVAIEMNSEFTISIAETELVNLEELMMVVAYGF